MIGIINLSSGFPTMSCSNHPAQLLRLGRILKLLLLVRKKIRKRLLFKKVQAFCEEKVLRYLLGVFWYA